MPKISHLQPPGGMIHIRFDRYSPFHTRAEDFGIDLIPVGLMKFIYPLSERDLMDQSYFFEDPNTEDLGWNLSLGESLPRPGAEAVRAALEAWGNAHAGSMPAVLCEEEIGDGRLRVLDTRPISSERLVTLTQLESDILRHCGPARGAAQLADELAREGQFDGPADDVVVAVERLKDRADLLEVEGRLLSLSARGDLPRIPKGEEFPSGWLWHDAPPGDPQTSLGTAAE